MNEIAQKAKQLKLTVVAVLIWVAISAAGFWLFPRLLASSMLIAACFWGGTNQLYGREYWGSTFLRSILAVILGMLLLSVMVGSAEYYFRNIGKEGSWTPFARIIAVEFALVILTIIL